MLRAAQKNEIIKTINNSDIFDFYDFELKEKDAHVMIKYLHSKKDFYFSFHVPKEETYKTILNTAKKGFWFIGWMQPGRISSSENFSLEGFDRVYEQIELWLKELDVELVDLHIQKKLINTEEKIEEILGKINEMTEELEDTFFTREEAENLMEKLDSMEKSIIDNLEKVITDKTELEKEIIHLKKEIEKLKNSTERISKKNWVKKCFYKMGEWTLNPEKRNFILGGIKFLGGVSKIIGIEGHLDKDIIELFPDSIQEVIPENLTDK